MTEWIFERRTRDGGASGEAVPNAVEAGGWLSAEELLVREAIQNSVDAADPAQGSPVRVSFRLEHLLDARKEELLKDLQLQPFVERSGALKDKLPPRNVLELSAGSSPLHLLYVEDFNTVGLGGGLEDPENGHFYRLLFLIGEGSKADQDDGSGGSFGFGKGVYAHNSNIRTIFVFSVFEPSTGTNGNWARLLGCAYLPGHTYDEQRFTGRAWFGLPPGSDDPAQAPFPLVDDDAVDLAMRLGFVARGRDARGTSILVIGCDSADGVLSTEKLKAAAETWWWPRILDDNLDVELFEDGVRQAGLDPAGRADLQPFIRCRNAVLRGHDDETVRFVRFNRKEGRNIGALGLTAVHPDDPAHEALSAVQAEGDDRQGKSPSLQSVAYVRRPGMVVTYRTWTISSGTHAVGSFQASEEIDRYLKLSEPMEHDRWDPHSRRLDRLEHGGTIVATVESTVRRRLGQFLKDLQPPPPPPKAGLHWLGRRLGDILTQRTKSAPPPPDGDRGPVSITTVKRARTVPNGELEQTLEAVYAIALKPDLEVERRTVSCSPRLYVLEGDSGARGDLVMLSVELDGDSSSRLESERLDLPVDLEIASRRTLTIVSAPFSRDWVVSLHIEVVPQETD
jgi:hypothetical protein